MKTTSSFLWQIIQTLSANEKQFFIRNYTNSRGEKLYLKLFSAIAAQKKYNEEEIIKKLSPAINSKNIAFQKHYLQQQICDAIIQYDVKSDALHDIYRQIQLIRVYRKKGLLNEALQIWKKATDRSRNAESFALLNLLKTEFEKMVLFGSSQFRYDEMHKIFSNNAITYSEYASLITMRDIYTEVMILKRKAHYYAENPVEKEALKLLVKTEKYRDAVTSKSFWYFHYYHLSKGTLLSILNDFEGSMKALSVVLQRWHSNIQFFDWGGEFYIEVMYMINYAGVLNGQYDYVEDAFNHSCNNLLTEPVQKANLEVIKFLAFNKIYNKTARYDRVEALINEAKKKIPGWEPLLNADMNYTANLSIAIASFALEDFNDSLYYSKRAFSYFKTGTREELSDIAQLLLLLITYNMNNVKQFEAQYRSTYGYFYKRQKKYPFETALVQCLHRSFYMTNYTSRIKEYKKALDIFEENKNDVVQKMTFKIFNYPGWLNSRIQRISYRQYVENTVRNANA